MAWYFLLLPKEAVHSFFWSWWKISWQLKKKIIFSDICVRNWGSRFFVCNLCFWKRWHLFSVYFVVWLSNSVGKEWQEESLPEKVEASTRPGFVLPLWWPWAPAFPLRSGCPFCASCLQTRLKAEVSHCCWLREPVMISRYRTSWILTQGDKNFLNFINCPFLFLLPFFPLIEVGKNFEVTL